MALMNDKLIEEMVFYRGLISVFDEIIERSPPGLLTSYKRGNSEQFIHLIHDKDRCIRRGITRNEDMLRALAQKEFALRARAVLAHNLQVLELASDKIIPFDPDTILRSMNRSYRNLPTEYFFDRTLLQTAIHLPGEERARIERHREWGQKPYTRSSYKQEQLKHRTSRGLMVRSKSEGLFLERLYYYGIDTHYEEVWTFGNEIIVPDFTFEGADGSPFFVEHMGMMDKTGYAGENYEKLMKYYRLGIVVGKNLILTFDRNGTIDVETIDFIIKHEIIPRL